MTKGHETCDFERFLIQFRVLISESESKNRAFSQMLAGNAKSGTPGTHSFPRPEKTNVTLVGAGIHIDAWSMAVNQGW